MKIDRILVVVGTRPEVIKMAPVIRALRGTSKFIVKVCATGQHREMLDRTLATFSIKPDFDLNIMKPNQELAGLTASLVRGMSDLYQQWKPDLVMVQGDTTTTFGASLAAFYERIPVAHIEAGLRTHNKYSPWPEEVNRCLVRVLATWHFAPTAQARRNLIAEGVHPKNAIVTGNTVIDALQEMVLRLHDDSALRAFYDNQFSYLNPGCRLVLVTAHRRESFGQGLKRICSALRELARRKDVEILYPVHRNPNVYKPVQMMLGNVQNIYLIQPQEYLSFTYLLQRCHLIITDSGGIQEEAPFLGKAVLLVRNTTERPEAIDAGGLKLIGTEVRKIIRHANELLDDDNAYRAMARVANPFGDGKAAIRIVNHLKGLKETLKC